MDGYLLDTNGASWACLESSSRHQEMRGRIAALGNAPVFLSAISIAESEYGMYAAQMDETTRQSIRNALAQFRMLDLDRHTAKQYGKIRARLFHRYAPRNSRQKFATKYLEDLREHTTGKELGIQENDLWIVCIAVRYNMVFVTADKGGGMKNIVDAASHANRTQFWD